MKSGGAIERSITFASRELKAISPHQTLAPKNFSFLFLHPSGGGCMPRPRISRWGESFQHAVQAQIPKTCLLIVLKDCIFTGAERRPTTCVAECAKKPHYASKQLGDRLHLPHGRGARRVAMVERPCPRDGGESRGWLREETPTTEDEETEIVTVQTHTYYRVNYLQERKEKTRGISRKAGLQES